MQALRRHQLAHLNAAGWDEVVEDAKDKSTQECLVQWAFRQLPLVVTRQPPDSTSTHIALGLPAPARWDRRRIALRVPIDRVTSFDDFPDASSIAVISFPQAMRERWLELVDGLDRMEAETRVHGSFGWQQLTGMSYLHAHSDIDLLLAVRTMAAADAVAFMLQDAAFETPRLDGELVFPDGSAVAWREWLQWRSGRVEKILVKRLHGVALESPGAWPTEDSTC